jgi:hypothetical protein
MLSSSTQNGMEPPWLTVIKPGIFRSDAHPGEHLASMGEIQATLRECLIALVGVKLDRSA